MRESKWISSIVLSKLTAELDNINPCLKVEVSKKLPYSLEILLFRDDEKDTYFCSSFETDILIYEFVSENTWKPRIVIEGKITTVTTHDAITYSQKASVHKNVYPYLRYGILLGNRKHYPLPGRLFRHGAQFDFMLSWKQFNPSTDEWDTFFEIIKEEIKASKALEEILYKSRSPNRKRYFCLHRKLHLEQM